MPAYMLIRVEVDDPAQLKAYQAATPCFCRAGSARLQIKKSTAEILKGMDGNLSGVFFTDLHLDHISGMPDIANFGHHKQ